LFEELFEQIVRQCVEVGLVQGKHLSVDGSFVEANAAKESRIPRQQLAEAAQVNQTVRQYLVELEEQNPLEEPVHQQDQVSTTDPDSTYATKGGMPARLGYYDNYLIDNASCVIRSGDPTSLDVLQEPDPLHLKLQPPFSCGFQGVLGRTRQSQIGLNDLTHDLCLHERRFNRCVPVGRAAAVERRVSDQGFHRYDIARFLPR